MDDFAVLGLGELGKMFGASALATGLRVTPITRHDDVGARIDALPRTAGVLLAVGEDALPEVLDGLPRATHDRVILLQNELWPSTWTTRQVSPTVILPWVLQKPGQPRTVVGTTPIYGRFGALMTRLCAAAQIPSELVSDERGLAQALADKYAFILTINALGVWRDEPLGELLDEAPDRVRALCGEATEIAQAELAQTVDGERCHGLTVAAIGAMRGVRARGRSARVRVERALLHGQRFNIALPTLARCAAGA